jgi:hypothetical protein
VPSSGCDDARHDLDERRFAGAVLAEDRVDAPGARREIDAFSSARTPP